MSEEVRPIITLKKITYPDGKKLTRSLVAFDVESRTYNPSGEAINKILPIIDREYNSLIDSSRDKGITVALDQFFTNVSDFAVVGNGLIQALMSDLNEDQKVVVNALLETKWLRSAKEYAKSEFRKAKKKDPIKYAETVRQIVDTFGFDYTMYLLGREGISIKRSTLSALCRVANETPRIKALIKDGGLKLTIAFELPNIEEGNREKIAEQISKMSYEKQKSYLKTVKRS